jgi:hypothetical protein
MLVLIQIWTHINHLIAEKHGDLSLLRPEFYEEQAADEPRLSHATASKELIRFCMGPEFYKEQAADVTTSVPCDRQQKTES